MRKLFCIALMAAAIGISQKSTAASSIIIKPFTDTVKKKIVHPKEAMPDDEVNKILNAMRQKRNDDEKVVILKDGVKDRGINIDQLIKLLNQFLTDEAKINSAEYAFPYITNYKAYLRLMDLFSQEGYKFKLEDFYDANKKK